MKKYRVKMPENFLCLKNIFLFVLKTNCFIFAFALVITCNNTKIYRHESF